VEIVKKSKAAQELIIQCTPHAFKARRALIKFDEMPLEPGDHPATNLNCAYTSGAYTIKFKPGVPGMEKKPFAFNIDFLPGHRLRVGTYGALEKIAKENIRIKWLIKNTNLSPEHFRIARAHVETPIPFSIDFNLLKEHLTKNGETRKDFLWEVTEDDA
jgi:hypothetical protein